ncbi:retrovirus-related pol polyprotein from transposon TNT 1-94 [Tanacetum coccineum]
MRMAIGNNIKSTLLGIKNQNAKDFCKLVEEKFRSADKALARTLMAELTTMKFDGLKSMQDLRHWDKWNIDEMSEVQTKSQELKKKQHDIASKVANGENREQHNNKCNFFMKEGHFQKDCPKRKAWFKKKGIHYVEVCFESNLFEVPSNTWWLDYGATTHVSNIM